MLPGLKRPIVLPPYGYRDLEIEVSECDNSFDLELTDGERIAALAKEKSCPNCHNTPETDSTGWHHIIGFRALSKKHV
jgi:hypothetical protein